MLELYHNDMSVCAQKVRMVLAHKGEEWSGPNINLREGEQFGPDFLKISPKGLVPVLVHDGSVINESTVIIEYLEEVFSQSPLMPDSPLQRAWVRKWMLQIDAGLHVDIATISFVVAFRYQVLAANDTPEKLDLFFAKIPDPRRAQLVEGMVRGGLDYEGVIPALKSYEKLLSDMEAALVNSDWLVGDTMTLADISFAPYIARLDQLSLARWWADRPNVTAWYERVRVTKAYEDGLLAWNNPKYLLLMKTKGEEIWPKFEAIIETVR